MLSVYHDIGRSFGATAAAFGADRWSFTVIFVLAAPVFWYYFFRAFHRWQQGQESFSSALAAIAAAAAPYAYLVTWGVRVPSWAYNVAMIGVVVAGFAVHQATRRYHPRWIPDLGLCILALEVAPIVMERRRR